MELISNGQFWLSDMPEVRAWRGGAVARARGERCSKGGAQRCREPVDHRVC